MTNQELDRQIAELAQVYQTGSARKRQSLRPRINRIVRNLHSEDQPIPRRLVLIEQGLDQEEDDFFDNMPV